MSAPIVLVTTDRRAPEGVRPGPKIRPLRPEVWIGEGYVRAVREAGGVPLLVPPGEAPIDRLLDLCDAVVLTGGDFDIHPSWYGEEVTARIGRIEPTRTALEIDLARACLRRGKPVLGVCGGMQALAVADGGKLVQDLPPADGTHLAHEQPTDPATGWHRVRCEGPAAVLFGPETSANSTHHQAVRTAGGLLPACGWSDDGVIEAIARVDGAFALGVQWHPETLRDARPYAALIKAARG